MVARENQQSWIFLDIPGHLNVGKACEGRGGTGQPGPELGVPGRELRGCEVRRDAAVRAARRGTARERKIRMWCLLLPNQGNLMFDLRLHIVG